MPLATGAKHSAQNIAFHEVGRQAVMADPDWRAGRYLAEGTIEDLRRDETGAEGYAKRLRHGTIGKGLNDYDAIFGTLKAVGFDGWVSIEDGVDGMEQLAESVQFIRRKLRQHWPAA
jgi:sugar phosphate isomerase/epimerase